MKWLDECPTSRQARQPGRQADRGSSLPSTGGVCVDRGRGWYWTTANKAAEPASRKQGDSAAAACLPGCSCIWLISENEEKSCRNAKTKWAAASPETEIAQCQSYVCVSVCVWVCECKPVICIGLLSEKHLPLLYFPLLLGFTSHASKFNLGWAYETSRWIWCKQSMHICLYLCVCVCGCKTAELVDKSMNQQWKSFSILQSLLILCISANFVWFWNEYM